MKAKLTTKQVVERLPAYVLGALEADELLDVDAYVKRNRPFQRYLREVERVVAPLATRLPAAPLSDEAKAALLRRVRADLAATPLTATLPRTAARSRWTGAARLTAVAALLLVALLGGWLVPLRGQLAQAQAALGAAEARLAALEGEASRLRDENGALREQAGATRHQLTLLASATGHLTLAATDPADNAGGALHFSDDEAVLVVHGLHALPSTQRYQAWLMPTDGDPIPVGLLVVHDETPAARTLAIPPAARHFARIGITVEPAGGSPAPTGPMVLASAAP